MLHKYFARARYTSPTGTNWTSLQRWTWIFVSFSPWRWERGRRDESVPANREPQYNCFAAHCQLWLYFGQSLLNLHARRARHWRQIKELVLDRQIPTDVPVTVRGEMLISRRKRQVNIRELQILSHPEKEQAPVRWPPAEIHRNQDQLHSALPRPQHSTKDSLWAA